MMRIGQTADGTAIEATPPSDGRPPVWKIGERTFESPGEFLGAINELAASGGTPAAALIDRKAVRSHYRGVMDLQRRAAARALDDAARMYREHGDEAGAARAEESRAALLGK
jgi:hypothetical protein